jgi:hypothetical protein
VEPCPTAKEDVRVKYLCLVYLDEKVLEGLTDRERAALVDNSLDYDDVLRKSGHLVLASALQPVRTAATVRPRDGKVLVTDGPFAETREQLGGFLLIEARDRDEAIQVISKVPVARLGGIEIRPVQELTRS